MNKKVSILIPICNVEKYLRQCLDSVVNQTLQDIEIICVNDGSKDSCPQILDEYAKQDSRIRVIHKKNSGYGDSLNIALDCANGEYISIVESDDFASLNMCEDMYNLAKKFDADLVKSSWNQYQGDTNQLYPIDLFAGVPTDCVVSPFEYKDLYITPALIASCLYKTKYLKEHNIRFLTTPGASYQDTSFAAKTVMTAKKIVLTSNRYYNYRIDNPGSSVKQTGKVFCICDEYKAINEYMDKYPDSKNALEQHKCANQFREYLWNLNRLTKKESLEFLKSFRSDFYAYYKKGILQEEFQQRYPITEIEMLINNPKRFYKKYVLGEENITLLQKLFSVKNQHNHKVIRILGLKIKLRRNVNQKTI